MLAVLRNPTLVAVSLGHLAVDMFTAALPILLVVFGVRLGLSNVEIGTVVTFYTLGTSLTQPFFGLLADRWPSRWMGILSIVWQAGGFVLATLVPGRAAFVVFVLAALGSGAYHPHGSLNIRRTAGAQAATATSVFFFFGLAGHALGPILAGFLLARTSLPWTTLLLAALVGPIMLLLARFAPHGVTAIAQTAKAISATDTMAWNRWRLVAFLLVFFCVSWPVAAATTFFPKWLSDAGYQSDAFGVLLGVFSFGAAFGGIAGGALADRWSRKWVIVLAQALSILPLWLLYAEPSVGIGTLAATACAGFALGMPQSVMIVMGQNLFPRAMGFGSGMVLGFFFSVTALAGWLNGWLADRIGLHETLLLSPWLCLTGAIIALVLPRTRARPVAAAAPATT
jgi:MFS transporter, FSR family, fosmidomycin resistance protein